jgi:uncharacterized protein (TIGR02600 family)
MKINLPKSLRRPAQREKAIALITVISLVAVMTVFILALLSVSRTENVTSRSNSDAERARQYADMAVNIVMGQIWAGTKQTGASTDRQIWASQPGAIRKYNNNGSFNSGYRLYSSSEMVVTGTEQKMIADASPADWATQVERYTDLNEPVVRPAPAGIGPPRLYFPIVDPRGYIPSREGAADNPNVEGFWYDPGFSGVKSASAVDDTSTRLPMPVEWLYVLKSGAVGALGAGNRFVSSAGADGTPSIDNPIVGRIAFWTDDETCKLNINTAGEPTVWSIPTFFHARDQSWSFYQPTSFEYQRYPGHPATVALSSVLYPNRELDTYLLKSNPSAMQQAVEWKEKVYRIMPKMNDGGSKAGTVPFWKFVKLDTSGDGNPDNQIESAITLTNSIQERLYASVDELLFSETLSGGERGMHTTGFDNLFNSPSELERVRFFLTAHSRMPETTMFGTPRVAIWPVADSSIPNYQAYRTGYDQLVAFCASLGKAPTGALSGNSYFFSRKDSQSPVVDIQLPRNAQLLSYLLNLMKRRYPGAGGNTSFEAKYGDDCSQILVNIFDYIRSTNLYDGFLAPTRETILQKNSKYAIDGTMYPNGPGESHNQGTLHRSKPTDYKTYTSDRGSRGHTETSSVNSTSESERVADRAFPGHGQVVPSVMGSGATLQSTYRGIARFPTISEFGFQFICTADGNADKGSFRNDEEAYPGPGGALNSKVAAGTISGGRTAVRIDPHDWGVNGQGSAARYRANNEDTFWYSNYPPYPALSRYGTTNGKISKRGQTITHPGFNPRNWNITLDPNTPLNPGERRVQAMLQFEITIPSAGFTKINPEFSIVVTGASDAIEKLGLDGNQLFDNGVGGRLIWKSNMEVFDAGGCRSLGASITTAAMTGGRRVRAPSQVLSAVADPGYDVGVNASGDPHRGLLNFDLTSRFVTCKGDTMTFTGADLKVQVWAGHDLTKPEMMVQEINFPVPQSLTLPVPQLVTISMDHRRNQDSQGRIYERKPVEAPRWWIMSWGGALNRWTGTWPGTPVLITPRMDVNQLSAGNSEGSRVLGRFADWGGSDDNTGSVGVPSDGTIFGYDRNSGNFNSSLIRQISPAADSPNDVYSDTGYSDTLLTTEGTPRDPRGADVVFTLVPKHGDVRQIASKKYVPSTDWVLHPQAQVLGSPTNVTTHLSTEQNYFAHNLSRYNTDSDPGFDRGTNNNFRLVPGVAYAGSKIPDIANSSQTSLIAKRYGDFDNGVGGLRDGPWVNKPDEGNALISFQRMDQDKIRRMVGAYFYDPDDIQTSEDMGASYNTPNRLVPSPGVFGSLPASVKTNGGDGWRTLLFRSYTPRNLVSGGAVTHPGQRAAHGGIDPADHYLMDLFWMPVVEPYAISEPFSTAGKVNINYQMVPFSHIRRATGIHAVLKGEIMSAVPSDDAGGQDINQKYGRYKSQPVATSGSSYQANTLDAKPEDQQYYWMMWRDVVDPNNQTWDQQYSARFPNKYWHRKILTEKRVSSSSATVKGTLLQFENRFRFIGSTEAPAGTHGLFRTASEICEIHLIPDKIQIPKVLRDGGDIDPLTEPYTVAQLATFWKDRAITGDNTRERPYTNIYGKITTQSNTFTVHMRAQSIRKAIRSVAADVFDATRDSIVSDYRGSALIERRIDPSDSRIQDYAANPNAPSLDNYYRFRVLQVKRFNP